MSTNRFSSNTKKELALSFSAIREGNRHLLEEYISTDPKLVKLVKFPAGWSLLHRAAEEGQTDICQVLYENGANINLRTTWGWFTPLHLALSNGWIDTAWFLYSVGADSNMRSKCKRTPVEYATFRGFQELANEFHFKLLYEKELEISNQNKKFLFDARSFPEFDNGQS